MDQPRKETTGAGLRLPRLFKDLPQRLRQVGVLSLLFKLFAPGTVLLGRSLVLLLCQGLALLTLDEATEFEELESILVREADLSKKCSFF